MGPLALDHVIGFVQYCNQHFKKRIVADGISFTEEEYRQYANEDPDEGRTETRRPHRAANYPMGKGYTDYYGYGKPPIKGSSATYNGVTRTYDEWGRVLGIDEYSLRCRVGRKGVDETFGKILRKKVEAAAR